MKQLYLLLIPVLFILSQTGYSFNKEISNVNFYSWSQDGKTLAIEMGGALEKEIYTFELESQALNRICKGSNPVWFGDNELLYCNGQKLKVINLDNGKKTIVVEKANLLGRFVISQNQKYFASLYKEGKLEKRMYDVIAITQVEKKSVKKRSIVYVQTPLGKDNDIIDIVGWINGTKLCVLKVDGSFGLLDISSGSIDILNHGIDEYYDALGKLREKKRVRPFDIRQMKNVIKGNRFSFDGKYYAYLSDDMSGEIEIKSTVNNETIRKISYEGVAGENTIKWSPQGEVLAYLENTSEKFGVLRIRKLKL